MRWERGHFVSRDTLAIISVAYVLRTVGRKCASRCRSGYGTEGERERKLRIAVAVPAYDMSIVDSTRERNQFWTAPNQITLLRLIFIPFVIIAVFEGHWRWALALLLIAALSDGLDGLLARTLHQQTLLGQYLDPIADKLLLSSLFLVLSILHKIPWKYTVVVFSRDISILAASAVLFAIAGLRNFQPSIFGKANTFSQISAVFFTLLLQVHTVRWIWIARKVFLQATFLFTIVSALHYVILVQQRLREHTHALPPAPSPTP